MRVGGGGGLFYAENVQKYGVEVRVQGKSAG